MKYILGCGITGIILKSIDKKNKDEYMIIGDEIGGQFKSRFQLGPRILKSTPSVDEFVKEFNIADILDKKRYLAGYFYNGKLHDECDEKLRKMYHKKTRGYGAVIDTCMNDGSNMIEGYDINYYDILKLYRDIDTDFINAKIKRVDLNNRILRLNEDLVTYDKIISTIPMNIFFKLSRINKEIKYKTVNFYLVNKNFLSNHFLVDPKYSFIYFPTNEVFWHRVTKLKGDKYCMESVYRNENYMVDFEDMISLSTGILENESESDDIINNIENVVFAGRYGSAKHKVRIHNIIEDARLILYG